MTLIGYSGSVHQCARAAERLAAEGMSARCSTSAR